MHQKVTPDTHHSLLVGETLLLTGSFLSSDGHIPRERIPLIFVADLLPQYRRDYTFYIALSFDPPGVWAPHLVFDNPSRAEPGINTYHPYSFALKGGADPDRGLDR